MKEITNTPTKTFIEKAIKVHNNKYDYTDSVYVKSTEKISIKCNTCNQVFMQTPNKHLQGRGCKVCANKFRKLPNTKGVSKIKQTTESFIRRAKEIHADKYDYSKVIFTGIHNDVIIKCNTCNSETLQRPSNHLRNKGCKVCNNSTLTEKFIDKATKVHNNKYDYSKVTCTKTLDAVTITCPIHGEFEQTVQAHLTGQGCPTCAKSGFDKTKPAVLYYLSINNGEAYKIGITNKSVKDRFNNTDLKKITVLKEWEYPIGYDAYKAEQKILSMYKDFKYEGEAILATGNTELFTTDVLGIDTLLSPLID